MIQGTHPARRLTASDREHARALIARVDAKLAQQAEAERQDVVRRLRPAPFKHRVMGKSDRAKMPRVTPR